LPRWLRKAVVVDVAANASYENPSTTMGELGPDDLLRAA